MKYFLTKSLRCHRNSKSQNEKRFEIVLAIVLIGLPFR